MAIDSDIWFWFGKANGQRPEYNDNDNDLSDPHGLNPVNTPSLNALVNALDNDAEHAERQNDHIINNNLDNHIYNRIQIISNTIPINSPGLTLQEVENLLMD